MGAFALYFFIFHTEFRSMGVSVAFIVDISVGRSFSIGFGNARIRSNIGDGACVGV